MLVIVGCNHRSAPVAIRERMAFDAPALPAALKRLTAAEAVSEAVIFSTCNRIELLVRSERNAPEAADAVRDFLVDACQVTSNELDRYTYQYSDREAVRHLFRVAAGLDSMILGEPQILGQVKQAYKAAKERESIGPVLDRLMQHCLSTAKRVRTETGISRNPVSVAFAAVNLASQIFGDLKNRSALVLGAGKMGDLLARHLQSNGIADLAVASRTYNRAVASAQRVGGRAVHWDEGVSRVGSVDIVVTCTGATRPVLDKKSVAAAIRGRRSGPLFLIDIAVPRDVDPAVDELDNVYLYDIDALQGVVESNLEERRAAADRARESIETEVVSFHRWRQAQQVAPTIVALREKLFETARAELERHRRKLSSLTPEQERAVEQLTRSLIQKLAHRPIRHLRDAVERGEVDSCRELYREIFGIGETADRREDADKATRDEDSGRDDTGSTPPRLIRGGKDG